MDSVTQGHRITVNITVNAQCNHDVPMDLVLNLRTNQLHQTEDKENRTPSNMGSRRTTPRRHERAKSPAPTSAIFDWMRRFETIPLSTQINVEPLANLDGHQITVTASPLSKAASVAPTTPTPVRRLKQAMLMRPAIEESETEPEMDSEAGEGVEGERESDHEMETQKSAGTFETDDEDFEYHGPVLQMRVVPHSR